MASWTKERSNHLSILLDKVTGTPAVIDIRQDFCRLQDCMLSCIARTGIYYTGSKAEGLDLPGSDEDYMYDINNKFNIRVTQSLLAIPEISDSDLLYLSTEDTPPCFATLRFMNQIKHHKLLPVSRNIKGNPHLSSDLLVQKELLNSQRNQGACEKHTRQGPSVELWSEFHRSDPGTDNVPSVHCPFWPKDATEWIKRPRRYEWPTAREISSIVEFGCHLVPVGHPHSSLKGMQWRISFSIAERILVWSFNHMQMQCYAMMKIILKEFIKVRCNPQNQVLCSYFIKTFLFWEFESNELHFWRRDNIRECITYLMTKFSQCLREGVIRHYFFPKFNLLSIKLTREAQIELLHLLDIVVQSNIGIMKKCRTLRTIWTEFLNSNGRMNNSKRNLLRKNELTNDECMKTLFSHLYALVLSAVHIPNISHFDCMWFVKQTDNASCKTKLKSLILTSIASTIEIHHCTSLQFLRNKDIYKLYGTANNTDSSFDISTCKLWYAMALLKKKDYTSCLMTVNNLLSRIPPFAMYKTGMSDWIGRDAKSLYIDMYFGSDIPITKKAPEAWLLDLLLFKTDFDIFPLAIQFELNFVGYSIQLSPFTLAYYLMFLCYHELRQFDKRDRALRQLVDVAHDPTRNLIHHSFNIAGQCLLMAGETSRARDLFTSSFLTTKPHPPYHKRNSALHYLRFLSQ